MTTETREQLSAPFQIVLFIGIVTVVFTWLAGLVGCTKQ